MTDLIIRPTTKYVKTSAIAIVAAAAALEIIWVIQAGHSAPAWLFVVFLVILAWVGLHWLGRRYTTVTITGDRLRYETGVAARTTRNIQLSKIQDVRVDQSVSQRMFNVGTLSIETAGEASRLTLLNMDNPQALADQIMDRAQKGANQ